MLKQKPNPLTGAEREAIAEYVRLSIESDMQVSQALWGNPYGVRPKPESSK